MFCRLSTLTQIDSIRLNQIKHNVVKNKLEKKHQAAFATLWLSCLRLTLM